MLSVVADQLRYPSAHTLFFIHLLLYLFSTACRSERPNSIGERVARVLLERVLASRPHPWGLVITFIELLDNETYGFWKQPFVRSEEEIYSLFGNAHRNIARHGAGLGQGVGMSNGGGGAGGMNGNGSAGMGFIGGPSMVGGQ
jgi:CCR4-NOT transcription complex subunit 1